MRIKRLKSHAPPCTVHTQVWVLEIAPQNPLGWQPTWRVGLIVMVVLLSVLVGVLVFVVMLSNLQYRDLVW